MIQTKNAAAVSLQHDLRMAQSPASRCSLQSCLRPRVQICSQPAQPAPGGPLYLPGITSSLSSPFLLLVQPNAFSFFTFSWIIVLALVHPLWDLIFLAPAQEDLVSHKISSFLLTRNVHSVLGTSENWSKLFFLSPSAGFAIYFIKVFLVNSLPFFS